MSKVIHRMSNGREYVYESKSYWDKQKKAPRTKQTYIGKIDPESGKFIPKREIPELSDDFKPKVRTIGPQLILKDAADKTGLTAVLSKIFPDDWENILTLAIYICHQGNALYHCESWSKDHKNLGTMEFSSQNISRFLGKITADDRQRFLAAWSQRFAKQEMLCYDITSVSSYAKAMDYVRYGYNRDHESLPQINLALLYGQKSRLPAYYRFLPGSISDVSTLQKTIIQFDYMEICRLGLIMDMGFYSKENINALYENHYKFLMAVPTSRKWIEEIIESEWETLNTPDHYLCVGDEHLFAMTVLKKWQGHRCYVHLFYNDQKKAHANDEFMRGLLQYKERRTAGLAENEQSAFYERFLTVKETPKRGIQVNYNNDAVAAYRTRHVGVFALISNFENNAISALESYRNKDVVEKCFDDLKSEEDCKRLRMHSDALAENKMFLCFLALILRSSLSNSIRQNEDLVRLGVPRILREMNTLREVTVEHRYRQAITEPTKTQRLVLETLQITVP